MLEWLRVDFIFSREGLTEENGVISLNEHDDLLKKVMTVIIIIIIIYAHQLKATGRKTRLDIFERQIKTSSICISLILS